MGWFIAYLISVITVPTVFMSLWCQRSNSKGTELSQPHEFFGAMLFCLLWPVVISILVFDAIKDARKNYYVNTSTEILRKHNIDATSLHDRSNILTIPEGELKFLLKNYRKNRIRLDKKAVQLIRDELMHRTAERDLLK